MLPHAHARGEAARSQPSFLRAIAVLLAVFTAVFLLRAMTMDMITPSAPVVRSASEPAVLKAKAPPGPPKAGGIGPRPGTKPPGKEPVAAPAARAPQAQPSQPAAAPAVAAVAAASPAGGRAPDSAQRVPPILSATVTTSATTAPITPTSPTEQPLQALQASALGAATPPVTAVPPSLLAGSAATKVQLLKELLIDAKSAKKSTLAAEIEDQIRKLEAPASATTGKPVASPPAASAKPTPVEPLKTIAEKAAAKNRIYPKVAKVPPAPAAKPSPPKPATSVSAPAVSNPQPPVATAASPASPAVPTAAAPSAAVPASGVASPAAAAAAPVAAASAAPVSTSAASAPAVRVKPALPANQVFDVANLVVVWDFGACGCTGWAAETIAFVLGLYERVGRLGIIAGSDCWCPGLDPGVLRVLTTLQRQPMAGWDVDVFISHKPPSRYPAFPYNGVVKLSKRPLFVVGRSMSEVHRVTDEWAQRVRTMVDQVWLPAQPLVAPFVDAGVEPAKLRVVPEPIDTALYDRASAKPVKLLGEPGAFKFLSVFKFEPRKGWDNLVRAFFEEFSAADRVELHLQTYLYGDFAPRDPQRVMARIKDFVKTLPVSKTRAESDLPFNRVFVYAEERSTAEMPGLYMAANAFVLPTRGEGWGLPLMEAMLMGLPTIATNWSGHLQFMKPHNSYLVPVASMSEAIGPDFAKGQLWAEASIPELKRLMRYVATHPKAARQRGKIAAREIAAQYSIPAVAGLVVEQLTAIMREQGIVGALFGKPADAPLDVPPLAQIHSFGKPRLPQQPQQPVATAAVVDSELPADEDGEEAPVRTKSSTAKKPTKSKPKKKRQKKARSAAVAAAASVADVSEVAAAEGLDAALLRERLAAVLAEKRAESESAGAGAGAAAADADADADDGDGGGGGGDAARPPSPKPPTSSSRRKTASAESTFSKLKKKNARSLG